MDPAAARLAEHDQPSRGAVLRRHRDHPEPPHVVRRVDPADADRPPGRLPASAVGDGTADPLAISEYLRANLSVTGQVTAHAETAAGGTIDYEGPGTTASVEYTTSTGAYTLEATSYGLVGVLNDLHKGRHAGTSFRWLIDLSGGLLTLVAATGLILQLYIRRSRRTGLVLVGLGRVGRRSCSWSSTASDSSKSTCARHRRAEFHLRRAQWPPAPPPGPIQQRSHRRVIQPLHTHDRRQRVGGRRVRGDDGHPAGALDRPSRPRVEDVPEPLPGDLETTPSRAAAGQPARRQMSPRPMAGALSIVEARILDRHPHRSRPGQAKVATHVDHHPLDVRASMPASAARSTIHPLASASRSRPEQSPMPMHPPNPVASRRP